MNFDVIFVDTVAPRAYDALTLENEAMGGTEATVIRISEKMASLGLKVGVFQQHIGVPILGQYAFFMPLSDLGKYKSHVGIQLRGISHLDQIDSEKKYVWLHDLGSDKINAWKDVLERNNATLICVSKWHEANIQKYINYDKITYIYNPVDDELYLPKNARPAYDENLICWTASPHKGLDKAISLYSKLRKENDKLRFLIFNPGYLRGSFIQEPGVLNYGAAQCKEMWSVIMKSLCVFYPCQFDETFGLIAAEANALGLPIATYDKAALFETVSTKDQLVPEGDEEGLLSLVRSYQVNRPLVSGQDRFRLSHVIKEWFKLFNL